MAWTDNGGPLRSRDELLSDVVRRGRVLRRRRQLLRGGLAGLVALAVAVPVLLVVTRDQPAATRLVTAGGVSATSSTVELHGAAAAVDAVPDPTTTTTLASTPDSLSVKAVHDRSQAPTTAVTTPTTKAPAPAPAATTPPTAAPATTTLANCTAADLAATSTTDKVSYGPGEVVKLTSVIRNKSSKPCIYGFSYTATFRDAAGNTVSPSLATHGDYVTVPVFQPGQTYEGNHSWDEKRCTESGGTYSCAQSPAGSYSGVVTWRLPGGETLDAPAAFKLVA